jgi:hypothetical protein
MTKRVACPARRRFLELTMGGAVAAPLASGFLVRLARAQERVSEDEEMAQQLGYVHDASEVDPAEWPTYEEGQVCANCELFGEADAEGWGPCQIFDNRLVAAEGWCAAWIAEEV